MPLPDREFDTTEVAVPWRLLGDRGHEIVFATQAEAYVEDEVIAALDDPAGFERGPRTTKRGTDADDSAAFVVEDGNYLSARWGGSR